MKTFSNCGGIDEITCTQATNNVWINIPYFDNFLEKNSLKKH